MFVLALNPPACKSGGLSEYISWILLLPATILVTRIRIVLTKLFLVLQVLVCAPSNVAVDQLAEKISATGLKVCEYYCSNFNSKY